MRAESEQRTRLADGHTGRLEGVTVEEIGRCRDAERERAGGGRTLYRASGDGGGARPRTLAAHPFVAVADAQQEGQATHLPIVSLFGRARPLARC